MTTPDARKDAEEIWNNNLCVGTFDSCCEFHLKKTDVERILNQFAEALTTRDKRIEELERELDHAYNLKLDHIDKEIAKFQKDPDWESAIQHHIIEVAALKEENERLKFEKAKVEIAADSSSYLAAFPAIDRLERENERMREALEEIFYKLKREAGEMVHNEYFELAKAALSRISRKDGPEDIKGYYKEPNCDGH